MPIFTTQNVSCRFKSIIRYLMNRYLMIFNENKSFCIEKGSKHLLMKKNVYTHLLLNCLNK